MSKKKKSKKLKKAAKAKLAKKDKQLLSASDALLIVSVETGKKWRKLFKQSITITKPIKGKQIDMFFDTVDAVRGQVKESAKRFEKLLGVKENIGDLIQKKINKNKVEKLLSTSASKMVTLPSNGGLTVSVEQGAVKVKIEITERSNGKKKKSKKKSDKKKAIKKKSAGAKSKASAVKKTAKAKKITTAGAKRSPKLGSKTTALEKATAQPAKKRGRPAKKATAKKAATTVGAKRSSKPGTKRKTAATAKKATAKRTTVAGKRGRKPNPGKPGFDDLKKVMGIGAKMEQILNAKGVKTYKDLKSISVRDLQGIINSAGGYYQSFKPQDWKSEAALAAAGKFDQMKSGRR